MLGKGKTDKATTSRSIPLLTISLLVTIVLAVLAFVHVSQRTSYDEQYILRASEQQVLSQQIAKYALEAASGNKGAFSKLREARDRFATLLNDLKIGNPSAGIPASPTEVADELAKVEESWLRLKSPVDEILRNKDSILTVGEFIDVVKGLIPELEASSDNVAQLLVKAQAEQDQIYVASRQLMLARRIDNNITRILAGGADSAIAIDEFSLDADEFGRVLNGMLNGDEMLNLKRITDPQGVKELRATSKVFSQVNDHAYELLELAPNVLPALEVTSSLTPASDVLNFSAEGLVAAYGQAPGRFTLGPIKAGPLLVAILGAIAALLLLFLGWSLIRDSRRREQISANQYKQNQDAIRRLLEEMGDLAEGDLSIEATVSEDITGAIADSINIAVEEMRTLVETINEAAVNVTSSAQETRGTAMHLTDATQHQIEQINTASQTVRRISEAISGMATDAVKSVEVARSSVEIANRGNLTVRKTIDGMDGIRDRIQETAKRMKRLGESSQEIGNIVELIEDIADQTNILALNAAMQAAMAGEAGRGFAVVADEVQRLAERSTHATRQIEALVKTIQTDTQEVISSMEDSTTQVVSGAKLAEDAGEALNEIEQVSERISEIILKFADTAENHANDVEAINDTMNVIQEITSQTAEGTNHTAESVGNLVKMADSLRESVAGFKLPEAG